MESISNFFSNIGQGAADLLNPNPNPIPGNYRPPINGYRPPDSIPQQQVVPGQSIYGRPNAGNPNPVNQFSKAIEEITRNDDFQCIPKVICEMVGSQRRQPGILGSPIFSSYVLADVFILFENVHLFTRFHHLQYHIGRALHVGWFSLWSSCTTRSHIR